MCDPAAKPPLARYAQPTIDRTSGPARSPDTRGDNVSVSETPDAALGACAAGVMRKATFAKTQNGGTFTYPFAF